MLAGEGRMGWTVSRSNRGNTIYRQVEGGNAVLSLAPRREKSHTLLHSIVRVTGTTRSKGVCVQSDAAEHCAQAVGPVTAARDGTRAAVDMP